MNNLPNLTQIDLRRQSRVLHLSYDNGEQYSLSFEFLRVHSPSAEVRGHGPGQGVQGHRLPDLPLLDLHDPLFLGGQEGQGPGLTTDVSQRRDLQSAFRPPEPGRRLRPGA